MKHTCEFCDTAVESEEALATLDSIKIDSKAYVAVEQRTCKGCDLIDKCNEVGYCTAGRRSDNRDVIWKELTPENCNFLDDDCNKDCYHCVHAGEEL